MSGLAGALGGMTQANAFVSTLGAANASLLISGVGGTSQVGALTQGLGGIAAVGTLTQSLGAGGLASLANSVGGAANMGSFTTALGGVANVQQAVTALGGAANVGTLVNSIGGVGQMGALTQALGGAQGFSQVAQSLGGGAGMTQIMQAAGGIPALTQLTQAVGGVSGLGSLTQSLGGAAGLAQLTQAVGVPGMGQLTQSLGGVAGIGQLAQSLGGAGGLTQLAQSLGGAGGLGQLAQTLGGVAGIGQLAQTLGGAGGLAQLAQSAGGIAGLTSILGSAGGALNLGNLANALGGAGALANAVELLGPGGLTNALQSLGAGGLVGAVANAINALLGGPAGACGGTGSTTDPGTAPTTPGVGLPSLADELAAMLNQVAGILTGLGYNNDSDNVGGTPPACKNVVWNPDGGAKQITVSNAAQLQQALNDLKGSGGTILLQGGNYGNFNLNNYNPGSNVTIGAADSSNPPVFNGLNINNSSNLTIGGMSFEYTGPAKTIPPAIVQISNSKNIQVVNSTFEGYTIQPGQYTPPPPPVNPTHAEQAAYEAASIDITGYPAGMGLQTTQSSNVTIQGNTFNHLMTGASVKTGTSNSVIGNTYSNIGHDSLDISGGDGVLIEGNYIAPADNSGHMPHSDAIQVMNMSNHATTGLTIRNNVIVTGTTADHAIFMGNEQVTSQGCTSSSCYYQNIVVEDNTIVSAHQHGIAVGPANNVTIRNNSVLSDCSLPPRTAASIPTIEISSRSTGKIVATGNTSHDVRAAQDGNNYLKTTAPAAWGSDWNTDNTIKACKPGGSCECANRPNITEAPGCSSPLSTP